LPSRRHTKPEAAMEGRRQQRRAAAAHIWLSQCTDITGGQSGLQNHPLLVRWQLPQSNYRSWKGTSLLVLPMARFADNRLENLCLIAPDGGTSFLFDEVEPSAYCQIPLPYDSLCTTNRPLKPLMATYDRIYIARSLVDAATVHGADSNALTVISFDDLATLGQKLRAKYANADIIFVGDGHTEIVEAAAEAASGRFVELEDGMKNWGDVAFWHGPDVVRERLAAKPTLEPVR
jgi:hypothetical protein